MNTVTTTFRSAGMRGAFSLLAVNPNIPASDALQAASDLLSTIVDPIDEAAMGNRALEHNDAWMVAHTLETAKAIVDSVQEGMAQEKPPASSGELLDRMSNMTMQDLTETELMMLRSHADDFSRRAWSRLKEMRNGK